MLANLQAWVSSYLARVGHAVFKIIDARCLRSLSFEVAMGSRCVDNVGSDGGRLGTS